MDRQERFAKLRDELAQEVLERIRADAAAVLWPLKGLLLELAKDLFEPHLQIGQLWRRLRQKDHSLSSSFACRLGLTPKDYLEERRMEVAAKLLAFPGCKASVEEIGQLVGYASVRWFQRVFLRRFGVTAGEYRRHGWAPPEKPAKPETDLSALSTAELKKRLSAMVAQIDPALAGMSWMELIDGRLPFSTPALFEMLVGLSRELGRRDRQRGIRLAEKAVASLEQLRGKLPETEIAALEARGWAWVGNARRLAHDLWASEEAFAKARAMLPAAASIEVEGEVIYLEVGLRIAQRRLDEALEITDRRIELYRRNGTPKQLAEALLDRGEILRLRGESTAAMPSLEEANQLADKHREPLLTLATLQILAVTQMQSGAVEKAWQIFPDLQALSRSLEHPQAATQVAWLEGRIHAAQGDLETAAKILWKVRETFASTEDSGNEAMVMLDLAELEISRNQAAAAARLATDALAALERMDINQEATGALILLRQALAASDLTATALCEVRKQLELR